MKKIKTSLLAITMLTAAHTALAQSSVSLDGERDGELSAVSSFASMKEAPTALSVGMTSTEEEMKEAATTLGVGAGTALGFSKISYYAGYMGVSALAKTFDAFLFAKTVTTLSIKVAPLAALPFAAYYAYTNWSSTATYGEIGTKAWNAAWADGASLWNTMSDYASSYTTSLVNAASPYATSLLNAASPFVPAAIRNGDIFTGEGLGYLPEGIAAAGLTLAGGKVLSATGQAGLKLLDYAPKVASVASMAFGGLLKHIGYQPILDIVSITHKGLSNTMRKIANAVTDEFSNVIRQIANVKVEGSNSTAIDTVQ